MVSKGTIQRPNAESMGINLYQDERAYVANIAAIYGLSLAAAIRWIINDHRRIKREQEIE